jgi:hypothetical protein
MKPTYTIT